jgi:aryl-alcohol dehydrogenase-like predicted oxidoreductase
LILEHIINKIALGSVQFGLDYGISNSKGKSTPDDVASILQTAIRYGVDTIDTAYAYGDSEDVIGRMPFRDSFKIVSKFPRLSGTERPDMFLQKTLSKLNVKKLYAYLAHDPSSLIDHNTAWECLLNLKGSGTVGKIGYSLYSPNQLFRLLDMNFIPDIVQVPFNVFDRRFQSTFTTLKSIGAEIHVRSVFLQGLFFLDPERLLPFFNPVRDTLRRLAHQLPDPDLKAAALLRFVIDQHEIDKAVIGVNNHNQLLMNIENIHVASSINWESFAIDDENILLPFNWPKTK